MKFRTTKRDVMSQMNTVIKVGYCSLCTLLKYSEPIAYTRGKYGWNANVYLLGGRWKGVAIVTGYRPFGNVAPADITRRYEEMARKADKASEFGPVEAYDLLDRYVEEVIDQKSKQRNK